MVKEMTILCDICKEQKANTKCFLCEKDICDDHNFGGRHSVILINAMVYNDNIFNIDIEDTFMDCCPECTNILKNVMVKKGEILDNKLRENLEEIKNWLLREIHKEK